MKVCIFDFDKWVLQVLYCNRIDWSKWIDSGKSKNREYMVCRRWCFKHGFNYQDFVCNDWHDLLMFCVNKSNIATITVKGGNCCCIIHGIGKHNTINLLGKSVVDNRGYI